MSPSPRVDHAHSHTETPSSGIALAGERIYLRWTGYAAVAVVLILAVGVGWYVIGANKSNSEMSIVFQGRHFDKAGRRAALDHLNQSGIAAMIGVRGELLVLPDRLHEAQASLEKAGLRPQTLDEIRNVPAGTLSILESPEQRDQRRRQARENELAWHIKRLDEIADAHVSVETSSGGTRWIGKKDSSRPRVRIYVELEDPAKGLSDNAVERIEQLILASLPNASPGLVTIHDARRIYRMANQGVADPAQPAAKAELAESETALSAKIRESIPELSAATVKVALRQVEESAGVESPPASPAGENSTKIYFNRPVSLSDAETAPPQGAKSTRTQRVRIQILPSPETVSSVTDADHRRQIRDRISKLIAPVLVEQVEWLSMPENGVAGSRNSQIAAVEEPPAAEVASGGSKPMPETPLTPIDESTRSALSPWIMGGVGLALVAGFGFFWKTLRGGSPTGDASYVSLDETAHWARNLAAAVSDRPTTHGPHELPADKAAEVLSSWLGSVEEREKGGE
ncbi:hypothetical protein GC170_05420 [bacterium]|nr:hypothetical protein [bacterium]